MFHHLHRHVSLYLYLCVYLYLYLYLCPRLTLNLHIRFGLHGIPPERTVLLEMDLIWFVISLLPRLRKGHASSIGTVPSTSWIFSPLPKSECGRWYATQIEKQRKEHTICAVGKGVCEPHATTDICSPQWLCGGGGRKEGVEGGRGSQSVMVVAGEEVREERVARAPDRSNAPAKETRLTPCTRAPGLWDATRLFPICQHNLRHLSVLSGNDVLQ